MSYYVSNTSFSDISSFIEEVKRAFKEEIPPVVLSFDKRENVEQFAEIFQQRQAYRGTPVVCKDALKDIFITTSIKGIYSFREERYPIQLSFKKEAECIDFANGWLRIIEKEKTPAVEPTPPVQETPAPEKKASFTEEKTSMKESQKKATYVAKKNAIEEEVNTRAEDILDNIARGWNLVGILFLVASVIVAVLLSAETYEPAWLLLIFGGLIIFFFCRWIWACMKLFINMSRNLHNINRKLQ